MTGARRREEKKAGSGGDLPLPSHVPRSVLQMWPHVPQAFPHSARPPLHPTLSGCHRFLLQIVALNATSSGKPSQTTPPPDALATGDTLTRVRDRGGFPNKYLS